MFRKEHLLNYFAILLMGLITLSEVSLLLSDEQAEETKEERELKEEVKEKETEREIVLLLGSFDLASATHFNFRFLAHLADDYLIKLPHRARTGASLVIQHCCLKIPFC
ncbi:hypothetical protein [Ekhidna sp.]|uniref:hypothetical protein n=1 Tax=Ekhidna sp. TaxID=2608089 RepID=UPI00329816B1